MAAPLAAQDGSAAAPPAETLAVAQKYIDAYLRFDFAAMGEMLTDASIFEDPAYEARIEGRRAIGEMMAKAYEGLELESARRVVSYGSRNGFAVFLIQAAGSGPTASGKRRLFETPIMIIVRVKDGKIVLHRDYPDYGCWAVQSAAQKAAPIARSALPPCPS